MAKLDDNDADGDADFMTGMKKLLGMDKDKVDDLLSKIDADDLLDLQDAISNEDKATAKKIVDSALDEEDEPDINSLLRTDDDEDDRDIGAAKLRRKHNVSDDPDDILFQVGDAVEVGDNNIKGTVAKPDAPNNTIGVKIKGRLRMVDKSDVRLAEGVLGMTGMQNLNLSRMRELAGIATSPVDLPQPPAIQITRIEEPEEDSWDSSPDKETSPSTRCMDALETLEQSLPNVTLGDLKDIRARIYALTQSMNESVNFGRRRKD